MDDDGAGITSAKCLGEECPGCVALKAKIKWLKSREFWLMYSVSQLKKKMTWANQKPGGINCDCLACAVSGRYEGDGDDELDSCGLEECRFEPYFESLLAKCDLLVGRCTEDAVGRALDDDTGNDDDFRSIESHLVTVGEGGWVNFTYGAKLWKRKQSHSIDDVELQKLVLLFELLGEEI